MIIAFTGAGISASSGIPTFQDLPGIRDVLTRRFANANPKKYRETISEMKEKVQKAEPNDAHKALAEYGIPIITMNIDDLHERAGSKHILKIHGRLPTDKELPMCDKLNNCPVLYGDAAPMYDIALSVLDAMHRGDILLVIGSSGYTNFSNSFPMFAEAMGVKVFAINASAETEVRKFLENHKEKIDTWENFIYYSSCDSDWLNNFM